jgi:hypothetical protein
MGDRRIAGNNQIEILHHRRGIDKSIRAGVEILAEPLDFETHSLTIEFVETVEFLNADETHPLDRRQGGKIAKRNRAVGIGLEVRTAMPANPDAKAVIPKPFRPFGHQRRLSAKVRLLRGNRFEPSVERARQAGKGDLRIEFFLDEEIVDQPDRLRQAGEESVQFPSAEEGHIRSGLGQERQISGKLDRIAKTLLVKDDDLFAGADLAAPFRKREPQLGFRRLTDNPAKFIIVQAMFEIAQEKQQRSSVVLRMRR